MPVIPELFPDQWALTTLLPENVGHALMGCAGSFIQGASYLPGSVTSGLNANSCHRPNNACS